MPDVLFEKRDDGVALIILNRPDSLNAMGGELMPLLARHLADCAWDESVRCVVLTGAGRAFCAGGDVTYMKELLDRGDEAGVRAVVQAGNDAVTAIREAPQPVIASINGPAAGAGANLALACDLRIASDRATFGESFNRVGLHPDWGGTYFLPRLVGPAIAAELFFTGEMITAEEAHRLGIFNRVVPHDRLAAVTEELARTLAAKPQLPLRLAKRAIARSLRSSFEEMLEYELEAQLRCARSADAAEGITAFLERREPRFGRER